jgi:endonuclease/exonuclease/phosphatase family metal-dependent hydrolase
MTKISNKNNYKKNITFKNKNKNKKRLKTLEGGGKEETIIVLSWNILWMAMDGINEEKGEKNTPEREFGKRCATDVKDGLNICATNVKNTIDELAEEYDFVALQEASQWDKIHEKSSKLKDMGYVHYRFGNTNLVTFYNKKKYRLIAFKTDFISKIIDIKADTYNNRPYHVLYLEHIKSKEHYIFINLHLPHEINREDVERGLSKNMDTFFTLNKDDGNISETFSARPTEENRNNSQAYFKKQRAIDKQTTPIGMTWPEQKYNIIVAGDFNDANKKKFWNGFKPFKMSSIDSLKDLEVKLVEEPPPTCCSLNFEEPSTNKYTSIGDYILVNSSLQVQKIYAPTLTIPTSDHLPFIIHLSPTYNKEDDATKLDLIKPPGADAAIIPAPPKAAPPEAGLETSLVLANTLIHEEKKPEECVPETIHILDIPGDGNCLFSSLLTGLIRLNPHPAIKEFETIPINETNNGDVKEFVKQHVKSFRSIIVEHIKNYVSGDNSDIEIYISVMHGTIIEAPIKSEVIDYIKSINSSFSNLDPHNKTDYETIKQYIRDLNAENNKEEIKNIYFLEMKTGYGDDLIIEKFKDITKINVVIFDDRGGEEGSNSNITIMGNFCYNGIWLHYNGSNHYNIIFPTNITNREYRNIPELEKFHFPVARKNIQQLKYNKYEDIIAKTTIEEVAEAQAIPAKVKPALAKVKPALAKVKPANPTPANLTKVKPAPSKVKPANPTPVPVPAKPAIPADTQGEEAALRRAGAARVSNGQAPTQVEGQSEGQREGQSEGQIQAPTQGQSEKVERQSEEQIGEAPTKVERQGQGGEANQNIKESESNSGNMFVIPLMGVVLALAITFLVKK